MVETPASSRRLYNACRSALAVGLVRSAPHVRVDAKGYVSAIEDNLIEGVARGDFEADLAAGDGNELAEKFRAAHSSSALAVNSFAPFRARPAALRLPGGEGFTSVCFERKCPHGLRGRRPPNLDVLAEGTDGIVAIESKLLEPLSRHAAHFAPAYDAEIRDARRDGAWFREMLHLVSEPATYRRLDAGQLVKHAFGIAHSFSGRPATLLYVYWEPANAGEFPFFAEHREEVARFAEAVAGSVPAFRAISYPELWRAWRQPPAPDWLHRHVDRLEARYGEACRWSV